MRHHEARNLLKTLDIDPATRSLLIDYIAEQERGQKLRDAYTDRDLINHVEARSATTAAIVGDLQDDCRRDRQRITVLEDSLAAVLEMIVPLIDTECGVEDK